jgi:hypothetical protein
MDLKETGCEGLDWIYLAQNMGPTARSCEDGNGRSGSIKYGEFFDQLLNKDTAIWN